MTNSEIRKALRFLFRLQKWREKGDELENGIVAYMVAKHSSELQIWPYRANLLNGQLVIKELPKVDERQLEFLETQNIFVLERR